MHRKWIDPALFSMYDRCCSMKIYVKHTERMYKRGLYTVETGCMSIHV